jgi:hypothetical protein
MESEGACNKWMGGPYYERGSERSGHKEPPTICLGDNSREPLIKIAILRSNLLIWQLIQWPGNIMVEVKVSCFRLIRSICFQFFRRQPKGESLGGAECCS